MITLDLTHQVLASPAVQARILSGEKDTHRPPTVLRQMLFDLLTFFSSTYETVFGLASGPPLHDPLAVAVILSTLNPTFSKQSSSRVLQFDDRNGERFSVDVVTDGLHGTDVELIGALGQSRVTPAAQEVAIPRGVDLDAFWDLILECLQRADDCNAARQKA